MATLGQLRAEPYWDREIVTPELVWLGRQLCAATGRPPGAVGTKGNTAHLYGAHRSQEWLLSSRWCTNRSYTVQRGLAGAQVRHIAALDFTPGAWGTADNRAKVRALTRRLVDAGLARQLPGVHEVLGTLTGQVPVGVDIPEGQLWSVDDSHLDHVHLTFDRRRLTDRAVMERVLAVAVGKGGEGDEVDDKTWVGLAHVDGAIDTPENWGSDNPSMSLSAAVKELLLRGVNGEDMPSQVRAMQATLGKHGQALAGLTTVMSGLVDLIKAGSGNADLAPILARLDTLTGEVGALKADFEDLRGRLAGAFAEGG